MLLRPFVLLLGLLAGLLAVPLTSSVSSSASETSRPSAERAQRGLVIEVLSNRRDLISGGNALVEIRLPRTVAPRQVTVKLNGRSVTKRFAERADGRYVGLVK